MIPASPVRTMVFRLLVVAAVLSMLVAVAPPPTVQPAAAQESTPAAGNRAGTQVNVELMLDSSGSMADETNTGETRIDAAKRVLTDVIAAIPSDRPEINVGFRVFGHKGNNTQAGKEESCQSSDLTVPIQGVDKEALQGQVDDYAPVGWTPIGLSLQRANDDFPIASDSVKNAIVLVTDGLETCDADPCAIATSLKQGNKQITIYVVGLGLNEDELRITSCIAENSGGRIVGAQNAEELSAALFTFLEELQVVITTGFLEIESIGGLYPLATVTCAGQEATDSNPNAAEPFTYTFTTETNKAEVPVGICDVVWTNPSGNETSIQVNIEGERTTFIRGSLIKFPNGAGEIYVLKAQDGTVIWQDQIEQGDWVWVLPGIYTCDLLELVGDPVLISFTVQTLPGSATQVEIFTAP
ncbi:MAG TPA: VWA domain-containing protein [Thermomicrobiales bacterium]|nr:VWA domain-containing protein [Thermomicrobiales bacterium]